MPLHEQQSRFLAQMYSAPLSGPGFATYHGAMVATLSEVLISAYPVCRALVGTHFFEGLCRCYIQRHPPKNTRLHHYGQCLSTFIKDFEPAQAIPYLSDVAALEWALQAAADAPVETPLSLAALAAVPAADHARLIFKVSQSVCVVRSTYPIHAIWQAHQQAEVGIVDLAQGPQSVLVWQQNLDVCQSILDEELKCWISYFVQGYTLEQACEALIAENPHVSIESVLVSSVKKGLLVGFMIQ